MKPRKPVTKPSPSSGTSTIDTSRIATDQPNANQNVRICHAKCESSQLPRTSERFT